MAEGNADKALEPGEVRTAAKAGFVAILRDPEAPALMLVKDKSGRAPSLAAEFAPPVMGNRHVGSQVERRLERSRNFEGHRHTAPEQGVNDDVLKAQADEPVRQLTAGFAAIGKEWPRRGHGSAWSVRRVPTLILVKNGARRQLTVVRARGRLGVNPRSMPADRRQLSGKGGDDDAQGGGSAEGVLRTPEDAAKSGVNEALKTPPSG